MPFDRLFLAASAPAHEHELIARLKQKDADALGAIYDLYGGVVQYVIQRIVHDRAVAQDLTQEAFLKVWSHAGQIHEREGSLRSWILMISRNMAIDYLRSHQGKIEYRKTAIIDEISINERVVEDLLDEERRQHLRYAVNRLTTKQQEMIEMAFYKGMSHTEIALHLHLPLGTVKGQVRAALTHLRSDMGGEVVAQARSRAVSACTPRRTLRSCKSILTGRASDQICT